MAWSASPSAVSSGFPLSGRRPPRSMIRPMEKVVTSGCYEGTSRAGSFAVRGTASAPIFLFANRNRNSKIRIVSVEQLESAILELSPEERRRLVAWLDDHRNELFSAAVGPQTDLTE